LNNDVALKEHYDVVKTRLSVESYADFWAAQMIVTNNDIINTRFFSHPDINQGRLHMIFYDFDFAMYNYTRDYYAFATNPEGMSRLNVSTFLFRNMIRNQEFRDLFVERLSYQLKFVWNQQRVEEAIDAMVALYGPEMARERERWDLSYEQWDLSVERLREYFRLRNDYLLPQTKRFFDLTDAEMERYFGGL
jgi:signal transduction histidine kinase